MIPEIYPSIALLNRIVKTPAVAVATIANVITNNENDSANLVSDGVAEEKFKMARKVLV